jgi:hypothetical protein
MIEIVKYPVKEILEIYHVFYQPQLRTENIREKMEFKEKV